MHINFILIDYIGYDGKGESKLFKDFERRNHIIEITPEKTRRGFTTFHLPIDVIDDDIVEQRIEHYFLNIVNTTLPQRVKVGKIYPTTRVEMKDDDGKPSLYNCIAGKFGKFG